MIPMRESQRRKRREGMMLFVKAWAFTALVILALYTVCVFLLTIQAGNHRGEVCEQLGRYWESNPYSLGANGQCVEKVKALDWFNPGNL